MAPLTIADAAVVARKAGMVATTESDDGEVVWEYLFSRPSGRFPGISSFSSSSLGPNLPAKS
ncbi:hypothetical protein BH10ACT2_BH10ACT2_12640 [soil metagenome]